jgi:hypothetical protein
VEEVPASPHLSSTDILLVFHPLVFVSLSSDIAFAWKQFALAIDGEMCPMSLSLKLEVMHFGIDISVSI